MGNIALPSTRQRSRERGALGHLGALAGVYGWLAPAYLAMFAITAYPLARNIWASFHGDAPVGQDPPFVGLRNYQLIVTNRAFLPAVLHTFVWTVGVVGAAFCLGLALALLLNTRFRGVEIARVLFLLPWMTPSIASAIAWRFMYNTDFGLINATLRSWGLDPLAQGWMTDPDISLVSAMIVHIWRTYGFYMIMLLGGLQAVPRELVEAAMVDGAGPFRRLWSVVLPQLQPVIVMVILLDLIWVTNNFDTIFVVTGGGPLRSSETLPLFVYFEAFQSHRFPQAAAGSVILFLIALSMIACYLSMQARLRPREENL